MKVSIEREEVGLMKDAGDGGERGWWWGVLDSDTNVVYWALLTEL